MTTTELIVGGAIVVIVGRQMRSTFVEQLRADRPATRRDFAKIAASAASNTPFAPASALVSDDDDSDDGQPKTRATWSDRVRWAVSLGVRLAFFIWLYKITDGAAFSPFFFAGDIFGGSYWQPVLLVLGLSEAVARLSAIVVRAVANRRRNASAVRP